FGRVSPVPTSRRSFHEDDDLMRGLTPPSPVARPSSDFDMPVPPPLPNRRVPTATRGEGELSAPPPPVPQRPVAREPRREAPREAPPRSRAISFDSLPPPQEPSALTVPRSEHAHHAFQNDTTIELLTVMVSLLENARQDLRGHSSQVARLLRQVAERMNLDSSDTYAVIVAGHIHDLGKMGQFHLTPLNCSEYEGHRNAALKAHDTPLRLLESVRLPPPIRNAVSYMYERFDGKGFPDKLAGKEIPLGARLLAVADAYADLTQNPRNPFRKVLAPAEAMEVLSKHTGTIFDPAILDLFKALVVGENMKAKLLANRYRALIVDPDPEESTVLELRMVEQGFDVKLARNAESARKALTADGAEFDLIVCEVELPDANGLTFLSEARKERWGRELPWVVYTQKQGRTEAQRAFDLGAMDFVTKPVQADVLVAKMKAMLEQRSQSGKGGAAKGVSGSLREMGLPDIVQVLFHGRKTGKLNVKSGGNAGEIHFLEGAIANALLGGLSGADAFYAMVRFTDGEFALDPSFVPQKRLVAESAEALLLEGMRRMDEGI
ncbi:MAG TPA: HD domain-containing phosphohydrolase, partial [Labilithrix sp.]|nr:HD domain-containing phosphohydrolase [Labilithrix sp.]